MLVGISALLTLLLRGLPRSIVEYRFPVTIVALMPALTGFVPGFQGSLQARRGGAGRSFALVGIGTCAATVVLQAVEGAG